MDKELLIKEIEENMFNPYPKDIFPWDNDEPMIISKGRFHEFIFAVWLNTKNEIINIIKDEDDCQG